MTEPKYGDGWLPEAEFRRLALDPQVHYRAVMRVADGSVWCAPLGTPDPWPADEADEWVALE